LYTLKKKEACRTPRKGSVDFQKHPKFQKKDKKFDRTFSGGSATLLFFQSSLTNMPLHANREREITP
jgi:hypothetical protein